MNEFVEECRREWRRLGVPDPIANEMAADLTADLEEAEAEGGSAEDVLGSSAFDPRRFAAAWAGARGVTAPSAPGRRLGRWPVVAVGLTALTAFLLASAALLVGRRSASVAVSVRRAFGGSGSTHVFGPGPTAPPFRYLVQGPPFGVHPWSLPVFAVLIVLVAGALGVGLAVLFWFPWSRRQLQSSDRVTGPPRWPWGSSR